MESKSSNTHNCNECYNCRKHKYCYECSLHNTHVCSKCTDCRKNEYCFGCLHYHLQLYKAEWSSENKEIDSLIKECAEIKESFEWIPFERFTNVEYLAKGGFGIIYKAWLRRYEKWDHEENKFERSKGHNVVVLKSLHNSNQITLEFINEIRTALKCANGFSYYGITKDTTTNEYSIVMRYAKDGDLHKYISSNYEKLTWKGKIVHLFHIIFNLCKIHEGGFAHRDFHPGNILLNYIEFIADFGLTGPADINKSNQEIYGVLPYMSPEVLNEKPYTQAADIYSFGMVMYEIVTGERPFGERSHDNNLVLDIYKGVRPKIPNNVPGWCKFIIGKCWDSIPENRPTAQELYDFIDSIYSIDHIYSIDYINEEWKPNALHFQYYSSLEYPKTDDEIKEYLKLEWQNLKEFDEEMKLQESIPTNKNKEQHIHPNAVYTSRIFTKKLFSIPTDTDSIIVRLYVPNEDDSINVSRITRVLESVPDS